MDNCDDIHFEKYKHKLEQICCPDIKKNKLQIFAIGTGYRVFCYSCCAMADGATVEDAIQNFKTKHFHFGPRV